MATLLDSSDQVTNALVVPGADRHHRHPQIGGQPMVVDGDPQATGLVTHIQRHDHREARLPQLQHQAQLAGDLAGIEHHQEEVRGGVAQKALHDGLVLAAAGEVVDAGEIHQGGGVAWAIVRHGAAQQLHREAGPIGDLRVAARESVVEGRLAGIGQAQQRHGPSPDPPGLGRGVPMAAPGAAPRAPPTPTTRRRRWRAVTGWLSQLPHPQSSSVTAVMSRQL